jgi:hypothetical protein
MKILTNSFRKYVYHILGLIFLTEIPALLLITQNLKLWLGYFLGSILSSVNFYFQAKGAESRVGLSPTGAKLSVFRNFYMRYLVLVVFVVVCVKFLEVNIFSLLVGLLIAPAIVLIDGIHAGKNNQESE